MALLTESLLKFSSLNVQCSPLAKGTLDKLPVCVKGDSPRFISALGQRNLYSGQVAGMLLCHAGPDREDKLARQLMEEMRTACARKDEAAHSAALWRITSLLIQVEGVCRPLLNSIAWSHVELFTAGAMASVVESWQWLVSARPDLEFPFLQEMAAAWQFCFERRMGLFAAEDEERAATTDSPLAAHENSVLLLDAPVVEPHDLWIRFMVSWKLSSIGLRPP